MRPMTLRSAAALLLALSLPAAADTIEQTYAQLCSGDVRNETCDALRKALVEKLSAVPGAKPAAASVAEGIGAEALAKWGALGKYAQRHKKDVQIVQTEGRARKFSMFTYGASLLEHEWLSDTELRQTTRTLESTTWMYGYGEKGTPNVAPRESLPVIEVVFVLDEARGKITATTHMQGLDVPKQEFDVVQEEKPEPAYREIPAGKTMYYTERTEEGDNVRTVGGTIENGQKIPNSLSRSSPAADLSQAQIDSLIAQEKQKFLTILPQLPPQGSGGSWLGTLGNVLRAVIP